jgi:hypothetical protein
MLSWTLAAAVFVSPSEPTTTHVFTGRVVDERRFPVADARVVARCVGSAAPIETTTGADGRFRVEIPDAPRSLLAATPTLVATTSDGRVGFSLAYAGGFELETAREHELRSAIVVEPAASVDVIVLDAAGAVARADVELRTVPPSLAFVHAVTDELGHVQLTPVAAGDYVLTASREGRGLRSVEVKCARGATTTTEVGLRNSRSLEVELTDADTHEPIEGATISATRESSGSNPGPFPSRYRTEGRPGDPCVTDARGHLTLRDLEAESVVTLHASAPHHVNPPWDEPPNLRREPSWTGTKRVVAEAGRVALQLKRLESRTARWRVVSSDVATPPDGTPLSVRLSRYEFDTGMEGSRNEWGSPPMAGVVRDGAVELAVDTPLRARDPIPPPIGWAEAPDGSIARLFVADDRTSGLAKFQRGATLDVRLLSADGTPRPATFLFAHWGSRRGGADDAPAPGCSAITDANGVVRLGPLVRGRWSLHGDGFGRVVELDGKDVRCELRAPPLREVVVEFTLGGERRLPRDLDLWPDGEGRSLRREDPARGDLHLFVARSDPAREFELVFGTPRGLVRHKVEAPAETTALDAAQHVAIDLDSDPVEPRSPRPLVPAEWRRVDVVWKLPEGENSDFLELDAPGLPRLDSRRGPAWERQWPLAPTDRAPTELRFDPAQPPSIRVRHPYLVSSRTNDAIRLENPRSAVTLHLEVGPLVSFTPRFPEGTPAVRGAFVTLERDDVRVALARRGDFVLAPPSAGEQRVLIDPVVAAPVELEHVRFTGEPQSLGEIRFVRGSTLRVRQLASPPFAPPRARATATRLDGVPYQRFSQALCVSPSSTTDDLEIRALGRGRFRVVLEEAELGQNRSRSSVVELDGEHDAEVAFPAE